MQLDEKQAELAEVSKANEDEELELKHQREKIVVRLESETLSRYDRIRKGRNGQAVVAVGVTRAAAATTKFRPSACWSCGRKVKCSRASIAAGLLFRRSLLKRAKKPI